MPLWSVDSSSGSTVCQAAQASSMMAPYASDNASITVVPDINADAVVYLLWYMVHVSYNCRWQLLPAPPDLTIDSCSCSWRLAPALTCASLPEHTLVAPNEAYHLHTDTTAEIYSGSSMEVIAILSECSSASMLLSGVLQADVDTKVHGACMQWSCIVLAGSSHA